MVAVIIIICLIGAFFLLRKALIRTVSYEIAGVKIPSEYNVLTGTAKPIVNYKGKGILPVVETKQSGNVGLTEDQVIVAKLRWAVFEQWANARAEYKGWQNDSDTFSKADDEFRRQLQQNKVRFRQIK